MDNIVLTEKLKRKEEIINSNISSIGMSENLIAVKRVCRQLETKGFNFDVQDSYLEKLLIQGMKEIKALIGDDEKFPVTALVKSKGTKKFFDELIKGKKDIEGISKLTKSEQNKRETLEKKIKKLKSKGKFSEASVYEYQLDSFNNPDEYIKLLNSEISRLEKEGINDSNYEEYQLKVEEVKRLTRIRERRYKNSESYDFVKLLDYDLREYIGGLLFKKDCSNSKSEERFLRSYYGDIVIDFEHILLLYLHMVKTKHPKLQAIKGVLYYKALETFYSEVKQVKEAKVSNDVIKPSFDVGADTFAWKRFPQYTRKYMLYFMQPEDYDCYYIEVPNLAQLGFLMSREIEEPLDYSTMVDKFKKAKAIINKRKSGIFFKFLSKEQENALLPYILTENFPMWHMDGAFKDDLVEGFIVRQQKWGNDVDMYNRTIKPYSLDMIGSIIYNKLYNLENLVDKDIAYIYYVSPQRIGIAVKKGVEDYYMDEIFGDAKSMLQKVTKPKLDEIVFGEWL